MNGKLMFLDEVKTELGRGLVIGRMGDGKLLVAVKPSTNTASPETNKRMEAGVNMIMGWCERCGVGYVGEGCGKCAQESIASRGGYE